MSPRQKGRPVACGVADAKARLHDARAFLRTAQAADDADVVATNAIHAAIAAADAICCVALGSKSASGDHRDAVAHLSKVDPTLGGHLDRCLSRKTQAAYETRDVSTRDANLCVRHAAALVAAAQERLT